jgi:hypothetical protein
MITEKEILAQLSQGKSIEDIANSFSAALNAAKATYEASNVKENNKRIICTNISIAVEEYLALCGIEDMPIDASDIQELLDSIINLIKIFNITETKNEDNLKSEVKLDNIKNEKELDNFLSNLINEVLNSKN